VGFASSLANLQGLAKTDAFSWLQPVLRISPALTGFIQGFLPPLVVAVFLALLPAFLKYLSRKQGFASEVGGYGWEGELPRLVFVYMKERVSVDRLIGRSINCVKMCMYASPCVCVSTIVVHVLPISTEQPVTGGLRELGATQALPLLRL
jgi:hypothetical protein